MMYIEIVASGYVPTLFTEHRSTSLLRILQFKGACIKLYVSVIIQYITLNNSLSLITPGESDDGGWESGSDSLSDNEGAQIGDDSFDEDALAFSDSDEGRFCRCLFKVIHPIT